MFIAAYFTAARVADRILRERLVLSMGKSFSVRKVDLHFDRLRLRGVSYAPAAETAPIRGSAEAILIRPNLFGLLSGRIAINALRIISPALVVRLGKAPAAQPAGKKGSGKHLSVVLKQIAVQNGLLEIKDPDVSNGVFHFHRVNLKINGLTLPSIEAPMTFSLEGRLSGPVSEGRVESEGSVAGAGKTIDATFTMKDTDLVLLEPYYRKWTSAQIESGTIGLDLTLRARDGLLEAPGVLHLNDLRFRSSGNPFASFMGMPVSLVSSLLKDNDGRIDLAFTVHGRLDDPNFSFGGQLLRKIAVSLAQKAGRTFDETGGTLLQPAKKGLQELGKTFKGWMVPK